MKNDPAFPGPVSSKTAVILRDGQTPEPVIERYAEGLTVRQYAAIRAMQGLLACYQAQKDICDDARYDGDNFAFLVAESAVDFADALIKRLEETEKTKA